MVGGLSAGGTTAIDLAINEVLPVSGFIGVCPGIPSEFETDNVARAAARGVRGVIIGGEIDFYREEQEQMVSAFETTGLECPFFVVDGLGHDYPSDFERRLEEALDYVGSQEDFGHRPNGVGRRVK